MGCVVGVCGPRAIKQWGWLILPAFGRPVRLRWHKEPLGVPRTGVCGGVVCGTGSVSGTGTGVVDVWAGRWATQEVGRLGRTVSEVAEELGCDWHTVDREIVRWGDALLEADVSRFGAVEAVGVDETLLWRKGRWKKKQWYTSVADVGSRQLLDILPGRTAESAASWF